jgi:hypothetical protein
VAGLIVRHTGVSARKDGSESEGQE